MLFVIDLESALKFFAHEKFRKRNKNSNLREDGKNMKSTGIVRKVDELGRVTLPVELRRTFDIEVKDPVEIYVDDKTIILKKYERACVFCGEAKGVSEYKGKNICSTCRKELQYVPIVKT